jgi:hypothetical protein
VALSPTIELTEEEARQLVRTVANLNVRRKWTGIRRPIQVQITRTKPGFVRVRLELETAELEPILNTLAVIAGKQIARGEAPPLSRSHVRYVREPRPRERWQTPRESHERGEADCEDLGVYLAGSFLARKLPARVRVKPIKPRLKHALTEVIRKGRPCLIDPSKARGMKGSA